MRGADALASYNQTMVAPNAPKSNRTNSSDSFTT